MSELKTALDLAHELGRRVFHKWDIGFGIMRTMTREKGEPMVSSLAAIPADAAEQIAALRDELAWAKGLVEKLEAEAAAGVEARRG